LIEVSDALKKKPPSFPDQPLSCNLQSIPTSYSFHNYSPKLKRLSLKTVYSHLIMVFVSLLFSERVSAQPEPCGSTPDMTSTCIEACVICDIDGYIGTNDDTENGQEPPGFCTGTAHHMQWIAFIAGSTNLTLTVTPSDCDEGDGLEVGIYQSLDCNTFQLVSNCDGEIQEGQVGVFSNTVPLIIGQYYYFVMDGNMDDICEYIINVTSGSTLVSPLPDILTMQGPDTVCRSEVVLFSIPVITGATNYEWIITGPFGSNPFDNNEFELLIEFNDPGEYEVCAYAYNVCDTTGIVCKSFNVFPTITTEEQAGICPGDCMVFGDTTICDPGTYTFLYQNVAGCDSLIILDVTAQSFVENDIATTICSTDSLQIGNEWYFPPGQFDIVLVASSGCDSIIHLQLGMIECEIEGQLNTKPLACAGEFSGELILEIVTGSPPFTYSWIQTGSSLAGSGTLSDLNTPVIITSLPAGTYFVTITDQLGNDLIVSASITEPPSMEVDIIATDYHGFNITCAGAADGEIMTIVNGGSPGYDYEWNTGDSISSLTELTPGMYSLTVTDSMGCEVIDTITLVEPDVLQMDVIFTDPTCIGPRTGVVEVLSTAGGASPYLYTIAIGNSSSDGLFMGLPSGLYAVTVQDANGCLYVVDGELTGKLIPVPNAGDDVEIELGYSTTLSGTVDVLDALVEWTPANTLSCNFCLDPIATPFITTVYTLMATSSDGCVGLDSVTVRVRKSETAVYIPNAFSPNDDGINDYLTVFGDRSVKQIDKLAIFSRWGDLVFEEVGFMPNDPMRGWDGTFRDKPVQTGVFTWVAEVRFLDDVVEIFSGDITLIR
jgi:gliding motility-associated-like protein